MRRDRQAAIQQMMNGLAQMGASIAIWVVSLILRPRSFMDEFACP